MAKQDIKTDPRVIAAQVLEAVLDDRRSLDEACAGHPRFSKLASRDRAFVRLLVLTVCRNLPEFDRLIASFLEKPLAGKTARAQHLLRLGAAQLLVLKTPPHAAVGATVGAVAGLRLDRLKGLVNAVLRRIEREGMDALDAVAAQRVSERGWLWKAWVKAYGAEWAAAILAANRREAPLDLTVTGDAQDWAQKLGAEVLPTGSLRLPTGTDVEGLPGFADGAWWVQDAAAALPVRLFGPLQGKTVFDLCAAPGGKTLQLAAEDARVVAVDKSDGRMNRLRENLQRTGLNATIVVSDVEAWEPARQADAVLLDAPCSATGTIRRHPELPYIRKPEDVAALTDIQARLLDRAVEIVKPGGTVVYATCSLQPEEGERQIESLLQRRDDVELRPVTAEDLPGLPEAVTPEGYMRCLPSLWGDKGGMDGFFAARLVRL